MEPYKCCSCGKPVEDGRGKSFTFDLHKLLFFCMPCTSDLARKLLKDGIITIKSA